MNLKKIVDQEYADIKEQTLLDQKGESHILKIFDVFTESLFYESETIVSFYSEHAKELITKKIEQYTKEEITIFSTELIEYLTTKIDPKILLNNVRGNIFQERVGLFLTELINVHFSREKIIDPYVIMTGEYGSELNHVGYRLNGPTIHIQGDCGVNCGEGMKSGNIIVFGNAYHRLGYFMKGGTIVVNGSAADYVGQDMYDGEIIVEYFSGHRTGYRMNGGSIHIKGHTDLCTGYEMTGGIITIEKDADQDLASNMQGGKIYLKGNARGRVGPMMRKGKVYINGNDTVTISSLIKGGRIYHQGKRVY